ncbi:MAG: GyrI-like domain-containing protein [Sphaerochaetaceae bacterium]|nr:GyrI-like domain-containing protein [Sphaerochaetaceae bacterium]
MKHEWRKQEKEIYLPKSTPVFLNVPEFKYFVISGEGNPNSEVFGEYIKILYALSYAVRMSHKGGFAPDGYFEYTVYPLEGIWDLTDKGKADYNGTLNKDELKFDLMIRQPSFVTQEFASEIIERTGKKKPHPLLQQVHFTSITDGPSVQMLHTGSYDNEPESFHKMEQFCADAGLRRTAKIHREIYLSDARKTAAENLKTVLRFSAEKITN